jgi:integrase
MPKLAVPKKDLVFRNAKPAATVYQIGDGGGLSLQIKPNGSKLWIFRYQRPNGERNNLSFGPYPVVRVEEARDLAVDARRDLRSGIDPQVELDTKRAAARDAAKSRFDIVAQAWLAHKKQEWADETYRKAALVLESYLVPALKKKSVATLTTKDVKPALQKIAPHAPNLATKARQYVNGIITFAIQDGLREDGKVLSLNGVLPKYEKGHIPAITKPSEIGSLVVAIEAYSSIITRAALMLTMYTALRPGVVVQAKRAQFDLKFAEWHIPGAIMKMRHDHIVPLPRQALALLEMLLQYTGDTEYVFPSPAKQKTPHLSRDALSKALRDLGFQGKHATHGFRGMLRTVGRERLDIDIDVLESQLAHAKKGEVQKAYDRTTFDEVRRRVMQEWANYIDRMRDLESKVAPKTKQPANS